MSEKKDTNPKDAVGTAKVPCSTVSFQVMAEVGLAMLEGALKYGRHNYRAAGVRASVYFDAVVMRHLGAWWEGQDTDQDSGLSHITKAIAGLMVLRDSMLQDNWVDDRPPRASNQSWVQDLNAKTKLLLERIPEEKRQAAFTQVDEDEKARVTFLKGLGTTPMTTDHQSGAWVCGRCNMHQIALSASHACVSCGFSYR